MVRTRGSGDIDVAECDGLARPCHRRRRDGGLVRVSYRGCHRGCRPVRCANYAVCGVEFVVTSAEPDPALCQRCICFGGGRVLARVDRVVDPCPICLEAAPTQYRLPQCSHHFCGPCAGRVLFRDLPRSGASDSAILSAALDPVLFTGHQTCPMCRATTPQTPWSRHRAVSAAREPGPDEAWAAGVRLIMEECAAGALSV